MKKINMSSVTTKKPGRPKVLHKAKYKRLAITEEQHKKIKSTALSQNKTMIEVIADLIK